MNIRYEQINKDNIRLGAKIQYEIFPFASSYVQYLDYINRSEPVKLPVYYLIYFNDIAVGTVGLYEMDEYPDTIWISWFGILKEYRKKGFGKKILFDTIEMSKKYNKKWLRLFTYEIWNREAQPLYNKYMQISEYYKNSQDSQEDINEGKCKIYGYSLCGETIDLWNDKYINIAEDDKKAELGGTLLREAGVI